MAVLKEHYAAERSLDFYVCVMFTAHQDMRETLAAWCSRLDHLVSDFRDTTFKDAASSQKCGTTKLVSQLGKDFFIQEPA
jgi:hypothetical protein